MSAIEEHISSIAGILCDDNIIVEPFSFNLAIRSRSNAPLSDQIR